MWYTNDSYELYWNSGFLSTGNCIQISTKQNKRNDRVQKKKIRGRLVWKFIHLFLENEDEINFFL